jgi:hypothetical protein
MENNVRLKITSSWISTSKDYLGIIKLKKEIVDTVKYYVENSLGESLLGLIEEAKNVNPSCILEQDDIRRSFFDVFIGKYLPNFGITFYNILPRFKEYNGRYVSTFDTSVVPEIRDLTIVFKDQLPRLFDSYSIDSFESLASTNKEAYDTLKNLLIRYVSVCKSLNSKIDMLGQVLSDKNLTKTKLKKELPKLYKLC